MKKRTRPILRFLLNSRGILLGLVYVCGLFIIPIYIYPLFQVHERFTFLIFTIQFAWLCAGFVLILYFLRTEKYRKG